MTPTASYALIMLPRVCTLCGAGNVLWSLAWSAKTLHRGDLPLYGTSSWFDGESRGYVVMVTNLPLSWVTNLPLSSDTNLRLSWVTNLPLYSDTNLRLSSVTNLPLSSVTALPLSSKVHHCRGKWHWGGWWQCAGELQYSWGCRSGRCDVVGLLFILGYT